MLTQGRRLRLPSVLRDEPQYRLLFGSQVLSIMGDRVTAIALPFAVLAIDGGVADVALVSAAQFLPFVLLALPAGVWADRWDRKKILIASDAVRLLCQLAAATLLLGGGATVPSLVALAAMYGAADAFFAPAFSGMLPSTVSPTNLQPANALRGLSFSFGSVAGPVVAGLLIAFAGGPGGALLFDAVTFAVSIALLVPLQGPRRRGGDARGGPGQHHRPFWTSLREGWGEVRSRSWVLGFLVRDQRLSPDRAALDLRDRTRAHGPRARRRPQVGDHHRAASASAPCSATCSSCAGGRRTPCGSRA